MKRFYILTLFLVLLIQGTVFATTSDKIPMGSYICPQSCIAEYSTYFHYLKGCTPKQASSLIKNDECTYLPENYNTYTCEYPQGTCTVVTDSKNVYKSGKCNAKGLLELAIQDTYQGKCKIVK